MIHRTVSLAAFLLFSGGDAAAITPGKQHNYTHKEGTVPKDTYQYSVWVPKSYQKKRSYPVVFYLHGGRGLTHPNLAKRNMVSARLVDNRRWTDAGYSGNAQGSYEYVHVAPVKPITRWEAAKFKSLLEHVKSKVNIDDNRVYVTGFSMGGQGTWHIGCGSGLGYKIAAMMPLGAWGCGEVKRGTTPQTCMTTKTPVWVLHCPLDHVSLISEQVPLFQNHLDCGGHGRFTMIPGEGHLSRPKGDDDEAFSMRMAWMLSQTHGTPFNYTIQVDTGVIMQVVQGKRPFLGDTCKYGFFEPGTILKLTTPELKDGRPFIKWASKLGTFDNAKNRRAFYTVGQGDSHVTPIYAGPAKLTVVGGTANPAHPSPGDLVTVTSSLSRPVAQQVFYWTSTGAIDLPHPHQETVTFCMPSQDITLTAQIRAPRPRPRRR